MNAMRHHGNTPWQRFWQPTLLIGLAFASQGQARAETINHIVEPGDNLYHLAAHYLGNPHAWPQIQKLNRIANPHRLTPGATLLVPKVSSTVTASFVHGDVSLVDQAGNVLNAIHQGDQLPEGSRVHTGNNSYLSLEFADKSVARIISNSSIRLDRIKEGDLIPQGQRVIYLEQGDIDASVTPAGKRSPDHFKVITPQAVAAVRGTRFSVTAGNHSTTSVTQGQVGMQPPSSGKRKNATILQAGQGMAATNHGLGEVQTLLTAPDLSQLPITFAEPEVLAFDWPALDGGQQYHVRIAQDENLEQVLWNATSSSANALLPSFLEGDYHLAVRALDVHGITGYEAQHRFTIHSHPSSPWLLAPAAEQAITGNSTLYCTQVEGAQAYHLQIANDSDFQQIAVDADNLAQCQYQLESLAAGQYFWRVASISLKGEQRHQGPYHQPANITVSDHANSTSAISGQAYWIRAQSAQPDVQYVAHISLSPTFESLVEERLISNPSIDLQSLTAGRYYVRVATKVNEHTGPFSDARIIDVKHEDNGIDRTWFDKPKS